ncbi:MAG: rRNA maturation RNase YbeY [Bacteroidota bacterium]
MNRNIHFFTEGIKFRINDRSRLKTWFVSAISRYGKINGEINIIFTSDKKLREINLKYLNTDTYTDIITFNLSEEDLVISGDIYISIERIEENAGIFEVGIETELHRVLIHGILHLLGFDDRTTKERAKMRKLEDMFLANF